MIDVTLTDEYRMPAQPATLLNGKQLARQLEAELAVQVEQLKPKIGRPPGLAVLMVGNNPASAAYVRNKERACARIGITSFGEHFAPEITQTELTQVIHRLNHDPHVDGILVQLPLPDHLDAEALLYEIDPAKDADGLHPMNLGRLVRGETGLRSCTPAGVMRMLEAYKVDPQGQHAVILGRSILVGKPMALMLLEANATVTVAHSRTQNLAALTRSADILVAAVGRPGLVTPDMVKPNAVVIDVGINRVENPATGKARLIGDVDCAAVQSVARLITPVPGGVGPMTVAMLLHNTVWSYRLRHTARESGVEE